ncbi:MAG: hypothetical protein AB2729_03365, partial [Candidatus Thiodiazotropha taylori]
MSATQQLIHNQSYKLKTASLTGIVVAGMLYADRCRAEYGINFPPPAADVAQEIYDIHMLTMQITTVLLLIVFGFVFYSLYYHRKSRG